MRLGVPMPRRGSRVKRVFALALAGVLTAVGLVGVIAACGGSPGTQTTGQASPSVSPSGPVVLTLVGDAGQKQFTMNQLQALPQYTGYAGIKSSTGVITLPAEYTGVRLSDLTDLVGGITKANGVTLVAKDGYGMTFSYNMIMDHAFTAYDPATGVEQTPSKDPCPIDSSFSNTSSWWSSLPSEEEPPCRCTRKTAAAFRSGAVTGIAKSLAA